MANKINTSGKNSVLFSIIFLLISFLSFGQHDHDHASVAEQHDTAAVAAGEHGKKKISISEIAFEHILDQHSWHLWGEGHDACAIPLPVILKTDNGFVFFMSSEFHHDLHGTRVVEKNGQRFVNYKEDIYYASANSNAHGQFLEMTTGKKGEAVPTNLKPLDFSITKNVTQLFLSALVLILLFTSVAKAYKRQGITTAPKGKQSFLEPLIVFVRDDVAKTNIGEQKYEKFVPYLLTVFFLIFLNNAFGLIPISANLTGNIAFTLVLSVLTLFLTVFNGNKNYWGHIVTYKNDLWPKPDWLSTFVNNLC